jgi:chromosome segregation ATPase
MDIISYFFQPAYFYSLQIILFVAAVITIIRPGIKDKKAIKTKVEQLERNSLRITELEEALVGKDRESKGYKEEVAGLDVELKEKEQEFKNKISLLESQLQEVELLKSNISQLQAQLKDKEAEASKEFSARNESNDKIESTEADLEKLKKELSLSNQMFEGLKGQYDELEEKFSQLFQQFLEEQKKNKLLQQLPKSPVAAVTLPQSQPSQQPQANQEEQPKV